MLAVMAGHITQSAPELVPRAVAAEWVSGRLGVDAFFVISGYIITRLVLRDRTDQGPAGLLRGFYTCRALRLLPAYVALLAGTWSVNCWVTPVGITDADLWRASTFTTGLVGETSAPLMHTWSLAVEEHFYLIWPPALVLLGPTRVGRLAAVAVLLAPAVRAALVVAGVGSQYTIYWRGDFLCCGCLAALAQSADPARVARAAGRLAGVARPAAGAALVLAAAVPYTRFAGTAATAAAPTVEAFGLTYHILSCVHRESGLVFRLLNWRRLTGFGLLSYSLYLWQQLFLIHPPRDESWWRQFPTSVGMAVAAGVASYLLIERPFLALRDRCRRASGASHYPLPVTL